MKKIYIIFYGLFFLLYCNKPKAQTVTATPLQLMDKDSIIGQYANISVDNIGNIYALSNTKNQIKKIGFKGDSLGLFNDIKQYGNIYSIDVSNPLKILLYYRDFSTIVVLDRFLNVINKVDLRQLGIMQAMAVSQSYDNQMWVFDQQDYKLKKIGENGTVLFSSDDFRVLFAQAPNPSSIIDNDGSLYLYDDKFGWVVMDYYGAVKKEFPALHWHNVGVEKDIMYGWSDGKLHLFNYKTFVLKDYTIPIDFSQVKSIDLLDYKIFILSNKSINIYSYKL